MSGVAAGGEARWKAYPILYRGRMILIKRMHCHVGGKTVAEIAFEPEVENGSARVVAWRTCRLSRGVLVEDNSLNSRLPFERLR